MNARLSIAAVALLGLALLPSHARAGEGLTHRSTQSSAEIEDIGEIGEVPEASGLAGTKFRLNASARAEFTSNAELSGNHSSSDVIFFPAIEAGYSTALGHGFAFDLTTIIESGIYADHSERSFIGYSAQTTVSWAYKPNFPRLFIGAEPYRFDSFDRGSLITEAIGTLAGADWGLSFNHGRSFLFAGYTFENYFSDPSIDNRLSNRAIIGISHQLTPSLFAQLWYQYQYSGYHDIDRSDNRNSVSLALTYQFNRHLFGTLSESFIDNDSTQDHASYQAVTSSVGISWQF